MVFRSFPPKFRTLLLLQSLKPLGVLAVLGAVAVGLGFAVHPLVGALLWLLLMIGGVVFTLWWAGKSMELWSWMVGEDTVELRRGVFWRRHVVLPRNRVQNVTISTGPVRSYLDLVTVVVHSAGAATPNIALPGVSPAEGEWVQQILLGSKV